MAYLTNNDLIDGATKIAKGLLTVGKKITDTASDLSAKGIKQLSDIEAEQKQKQKQDDIKTERKARDAK